MLLYFFFIQNKNGNHAQAEDSIMTRDFFLHLSICDTITQWLERVFEIHLLASPFASYVTLG